MRKVIQDIRAATPAVVFLVILSQILSSPQLVCQPADVQFEHITSYDGLSQDIVSILHRDKLGFLWIGTEDGLNRYDGYTIKVYKANPRDTNSLYGQSITHMCDYEHDGLLVVTESGLNLYDRGQDGFVRIEGALASFARAKCTYIARDWSGCVWIVIDDHKLYRYDPHADRLTELDPLRGSKYSQIGCIYIDFHDSVWVATESSLALYVNDTTDFQHYDLSDRLFGEPIIPYQVIEDSQGDFWMGAKAGLYRFHRATRTSEFVPLKVPSLDSKKGRDAIGSLQLDQQLRLWVGGFSGLYCMDTHSHRVIRYSPNPEDRTSLNTTRIYSLYSDPSDVLWVGTYRGGLNKTDFKKERFGLIRHSAMTPLSGGTSEVTAVLEDVHANIWLGGNLGAVTRIDSSFNEFHQFTHIAGTRARLGYGDVSGIVGDNKGIVWLAIGATLYRYDPKGESISAIDLLHGRPSRGSILTIFLDRNGIIWIGTDVDGVLSYNPASGTTSRYGPTSADTSFRRISSAWSFYEDSEGKIWIGGWQGNGNLHRLDPHSGIIESFPRPELRFVRGMYEDGERNLWVATWGFGISRFTPATGEIRQLTEHDGLPNNFVKGMIADDSGNLWLSTERGLSRYSIKDGAFKNFDIHDGLQGNLFYTGSCWKSRDGRLYFGGENGLNVFYPDSIRDESYAPPVIITSLRVLDKPHELRYEDSSPAPVVLSYEENIFSFEFVALDYTAPEKNQYSYRLEGLGSDWTQPSSRRFATYTHLDPGEYLFSVRGTNSDGIWSSNVAKIQITVNPAYWQTRWFRGGVIVLIISIAYGLFRYRLKKLVELERTRAMIATDLHDDIGASLTSIALFSDLAKKEMVSNPTQARERLERIADSSRALLDKMNDIVWSINPENDSLEEILLRTKELAATLLGAAGIDYEFQVPTEIPEIKLPMAARRNLFLIYKEIIHNTVRHSHSTKAAIHFGMDAGNTILRIRVADNGKGFDPEIVKRGHGLNNIDKRARLLHAKVSYNREDGVGTIILVEVPLKSPV